MLLEKWAFLFSLSNSEMFQNCRSVSVPAICIMLLPLVCFLQATSTGESEGGEVLGGHRAKASATSASLTQDKQTTWSKENLPPSDPKATADSHAISSCIIPINVTGMLKRKGKFSFSEDQNKEHSCLSAVLTSHHIASCIMNTN